MTKIVRILCAIMAFACIATLLVSCGEEEKLPESFDGMESGDRADFTSDMLVGCEHSYKITKKTTDNLTVETKIDGYDKNLEYLNCKIEILFKCTAIFEDMTEAEIEQSFIIELGFEGDMDHSEKIFTEKQVHSVYNASYEIVKVEGQVIKK